MDENAKATALNNLKTEICEIFKSNIAQIEKDESIDDALIHLYGSASVQQAAFMQLKHFAEDRERVIKECAEIKKAVSLANMLSDPTQNPES